MASYDFYRHFRECTGDDALTGRTGVAASHDKDNAGSPCRARKSSGTRDNFAQPAGPDGQAFRQSGNRLKAAPSRRELRLCKTLPFFASGTMIKTRNGEVPVGALEKSDQVLTRDHGFQPVLWVGQTEIPAGYFRENPDACPVVIRAGSLGANCPARPLCVASSHRILLRSRVAELAFLSSEVFAEALVWVQSGKAERTAPDKPLTITHLLMASHQVILADGAWVESLLAVPEMLRLLTPADRAELEKSLGPRLHTQQTARPCVTRKEAMMLLKEKSATADTRRAQAGAAHT
jgi:hypothetical protein